MNDPSPAQVVCAGLGMAVPDTRLTNADLEGRLDTNDAWIVERTGIRERRVAAAGESTSTMAIAAGAAAIKDAGLTPGDLDVLVVATATPDQPLPTTSAFVADGLGLSGGAFDLGAACAGFTYGAVVASSLLTAGGLGSALVIGAETFTRIVDPDDRNTAVLFGDGAGAAVLSRVAPDGDAPGGLVAWDIGCDGSAWNLLEVRAGGSRRPASVETVTSGEHWLRMDGQELFRRAVRIMADSAATTLARAGVTPADVDLFVPHQANARIIAAAASRLGVSAERTMVNVHRYGNTSAASVPLALAEAADAGRLADGDLVLLSGLGAGLTWATILLRWGRG